MPAYQSKTAYRLPGGVPGGNAEKAGTKPSDVSTKELEVGRKIEEEHTDESAKTTDIALDHLTEIPDYYRRLKAMEAEAEREGMKRGSVRPRRQQPHYNNQPVPYQVDPQVAEVKQAAYHQGVKAALYAVNLGPRS